ncbi:MAG: undecaprenyl-diphosphate phosphatase [Peptococcaceae bacterium]|nr:undecaprenyl-diphosphate phosphatase [Peptococcaceae bacterium]
MSEIAKAILFGFVQGITEWLPISSTGHMILLEEFLALQFSDTFVNTFFVVIQGGSILAVVLLFFKRLWPFGRGKDAREKRETWALWFKIIVAAIPAAVIGILCEEQIDRYLFRSQVVAVALVLYGVLFILLESGHRKPKITRLKDLDYRTALMIGFFQVLSMVPGTSRSGSTILGAVLIGCSRTVASEFSFVLAIPVMAGASLLKLVKTSFGFGAMEWTVLLVGCLTSFLVSMVAIRFLLSYVRRHDFKAFGWYRVVLGAVVLAYFWYTGHTLA